MCGGGSGATHATVLFSIISQVYLLIIQEKWGEKWPGAARVGDKYAVDLGTIVRSPYFALPAPKNVMPGCSLDCEKCAFCLKDQRERSMARGLRVLDPSVMAKSSGR